MSQLKFSITESGYSTVEVEQYFEMLQKEYTNAVEWGNEMERRLEEYKNSAAVNETADSDSDEISFLENENQRLLADCRFLAAKLKELTSSSDAAPLNDEFEQIHDFDKERDLILSNAENQAKQIIEEANKRAKEIMESFYSSQQKIISETPDRIIQARSQIENLENKKENLKIEIEQLTEIRDTFSENINRAKSLLEF